jgi:hypothetical protein
VGTKIRTKFVVDVFYSVEIYGTWTVKSVAFGVMRSLVVVGIDGIVLISNDCFSFHDVAEEPTGPSARAERAGADD